MKQKILLFTAFVAFLYCTLTSNDIGPGSKSNLNCTGGPGSTSTCSGSNCHASPSGATTAKILISKKSTGLGGPFLTSYQNDSNYYVIVECFNSSTAFSRFGYQLEAVDSATGNSVGTFSGFNTKSHSITIGGKVLVEHSTPIGWTAPYSSTSFQWKAPGTGNGVIKFFCMVNAVNNTGSASGDDPSSPYALSLYNAAVSVGNLEKNIKVTTYPNPFTNTIIVKMENVQLGTYSINAFDLRGKKIAAQQLEVDNSIAEPAFHTDRWAAGCYIIQVEKEGYSQLIPVIKR
jgi:hypothetical protein